jgi:hypothetical protein
MTKLSIVAVVAGMTMLAGSALAKDTQDGPTDGDLKAGYCFQVIQSRTTFECQRARAMGIATVLGQIHQKSCDDGQKNVERLNDYLSARGYISGPKDPMPIIIAEDRGASDWKACLQSANQPGTETKACMGITGALMFASTGGSARSAASASRLL